MDGLAGLPRMPVLSGGYVHPSARKALQMLGHGRDAVEVFARDAVGRVDVAALERRLSELGAPAVIIGNAGEVNAGDFDPIDELADVAARHGAWLHVDGAFGLFAALSPRSAHLVRGIERVDSIAADGHKWLNVPYESGFALIREPGPARRGVRHAGRGRTCPGRRTPAAATGCRAGVLAAGAVAADLGHPGRVRPRRVPGDGRAPPRPGAAAGRGWSTRHPTWSGWPRCRCASSASGACPPGVDDLDDLNRRLGAALLDDGRVFAGTTVYDGKVALRPAIVNWRTTEADIDFFVEVVRELAARLAR